MTASSRTWLALTAVCGLAFGLRVIGLQYGLPAVYNPDEVSIMARALGFARGTLNPHNFLYPTFYFYVLFAWVGVYLAWVWMSGKVASITALQQLYFTDPTGIYTAGRALGVAAGTATIAALYGLAARLTDHRTAIAAAIFLAVSPLHVRDSHYVKHDVPATLAVVVAYLAMTRVWPCARAGGPRLRETLVAGAACGVAFSTHYYCVFLAVPLAMVIVQGWKTRGAVACLRQLASAGAASLVVFFALSPFLLVEPLTAWRDITANRQIVIDRAVTVRRLRARRPVSRDVVVRRRRTTGRAPGTRRDAVDARGGTRASASSCSRSRFRFCSSLPTRPLRAVTSTPCCHFWPSSLPGPSSD